MNHPPSPRLSVLTAPGRGAVAVVRVWGSGALDLVDRTFRPHGRRALKESPEGRLRVGRIGAGLGDEVVAVVVRGDDGAVEVEVHCHGGSAAVALVLEALEAGGGKVASPRKWAGRSGRSRIKGEAEWALAGASTLRVAEILLDQASGAFEDALRTVRNLDRDLALTELDSLIDRGRFGVKLVSGWRVALAGRPNVGKSRLLNALAGYDRAIVDSSAGTTRDVVTIDAALQGWPVELADTAGIRPSPDPIEAQGVALARLQQSRADLVLVVLDHSEPWDDLDRAVLSEHPDALVVANKADLLPAWDADSVGALSFSAERGDGMDRLIAAIADRLVPAVPPPGLGVPFRPAHVRRLAAIRACLHSDQLERAWRSIDRWID